MSKCPSLGWDGDEGVEKPTHAQRTRSCRWEWVQPFGGLGGKNSCKAVIKVLMCLNFELLLGRSKVAYNSVSTLSGMREVLGKKKPVGRMHTELKATDLKGTDETGILKIKAQECQARNRNPPAGLGAGEPGQELSLPPRKTRVCTQRAVRQHKVTEGSKQKPLHTVSIKAAWRGGLARESLCSATSPRAETDRSEK